MSFHVSAWSIKNPVPTIVTFLILGIMGVLSFVNLGIDNTPNIDIPGIEITATQRGASPTEIETEITKKIEDAVAGLDNVDEVRSTVTDGKSSTSVNFVLGTDTNQANDEVRNAIDQIRQDLPSDIDEPTVKRFNFSGGWILTYAVASEQRSVEELSTLVDLKIIPELLNIEGVATVDRLGGLDREVRIDLDPDRLQAYGITATEVNDQIAQFNLNLPGGKAEIGTREQNIRTLGSAATVEELRNYPITLNNGDTVALANLGEVRNSFAESKQVAYLNDEPVVAFAVKRSTGSTLVSVEEKVRVAVATLKEKLPEDLQFQLIFTQADAIRASYKGTIDALVVGCLLTVITVGLFLRDWRVTIITGMALPLSIIPTFWVMKTLNYTLNSMTLLALALAVGNLVDDAICTIENIDQHRQRGKKPFQAALDGAREISLAVVATTATIVAVFLPVAFMGGIPGQYFQPFGVTVSVATMFSTLVAVTMTPMLSAYFLKPKPISAPTNSYKNRETGLLLPSDRSSLVLARQSPISQTYAGAGYNSNGRSSSFRRQPYRWLLTKALKNRVFTLTLAGVFFFASLQLIPYIPKGLFDRGDTGLSTIQVDLPPGSRLEQTTEVMQKLNQLLQPNSAVESTLATVGHQGEVNSGEIFVNLVPKENRELSQQEFQEQMRSYFQEIPGARIYFRGQGHGGGSKDVSIILRSNNPQALNRAASNIEQQMGQISGLVEVTSSLSLVKPELIIEPDPQRATDLGVSVRAIASTASLALIGDNEFNLPKFNLPDRQIPIRVQIRPDRRQDLETLRNLRIPSNNGTLVPLNAVAKIRLGSGPAEIERFDRNRQVSLEANLQGISLGDAISKIRSLPAMNNLPPEVTEEPSGDAKIMRDVFSRFLTALGMGIIAIYAILVLLYNNFLYPLVILTALPLSVGGALLGLMVMQKELGLFALIGIVLLMGLVTKNAILLVDFALSGIKEGKSTFVAVVDAGMSRLRPILMTSISTVAGMLPIALELGADGEVRSPMAIAVIGGFTTSTLLTLIVVPVLFTYVKGFLGWGGQLFGSRGAYRGQRSGVRG